MIFPVSAARVAAFHVGAFYRDLLREGSARSWLDRMQTRAELYELIDYDAYARTRLGGRRPRRRGASMTDPAFSPGLEGVIATDTELSFLDVEHERIVVRGYDLIELAQRVHYADVAFLLIHGALPGSRQAVHVRERARRRRGAAPTGMLELLAVAAGADPSDGRAAHGHLRAGRARRTRERLEDTGHGANVSKGVRILAAAPTIVADAYRAAHDLPPAEPEHDLSYPARFLAMIPGAAHDERGRGASSTGC